MRLPSYDHVWLVDFEYGSGESRADASEPRCMVAKDYLSKQTVRLWLDGVSKPSCPIDLGSRNLYVTFYAPAEIGCHVALGWRLPARVVDLNAELRLIMNGYPTPMADVLKEKKITRHQLLAALHYFDLKHLALESDSKRDFQELALRGGPYTAEEKAMLLDYNEFDVLALEHLLPRMLPYIRNFAHALIRGRYMACAGVVEQTGVPVDLPLVRRLQSRWTDIVDRLISRKRDEYDVIKYRDIDQQKFTKWLRNNDLRIWPRTRSGYYQTDRDTLDDMAKIFPVAMGLKEFLYAVRRTKLFDTLTIGDDGRNRFLLSPFSSKTGRNQPSSAKAVFGPATWGAQRDQTTTG